MSSIASPTIRQASAMPSPQGRNGIQNPPALVSDTVSVLLVTWNRKTFVTDVLRALSKQTHDPATMNVVVVDNAGTDGTLEHLSTLFSPERIVINTTDRAHEPSFQTLDDRRQAASTNLLGFRSLTIIRNSANLGGCGGFNTGLTYVDRAHAPAFVWLVDDDIDLPPDALEQLLLAAATDRNIGLIGSRTVSLNDRATTIETTIFYNRSTASMADAPDTGHAQFKKHQAWLADVGSPRGGSGYKGLRDVDVVSACSLLARWSAVKTVGFWDWRYFIYCDDADWCLRFAKAGYRVVLNLDAVVYHTPWNQKLTPARMYYAGRNSLWMMQKAMTNPDLRRGMLRRMGAILRDSLRAGLHRRLFHADIIRRTALDAARGRVGKTGSDGPSPVPLLDAFERTGALRPGTHQGRGGRVAVLCSSPASVHHANEMRTQLRDLISAGNAQGRHLAEPRWVYVVRNDSQDPGRGLGGVDGRPDRVEYAIRRRSRLRRQLDMLRWRPRAVVVFDQTTDFPCMLGAWNIHIDRRKPEVAQIERDGILRRLGFLVRWSLSALRCIWFAVTIRPHRSNGVYG